jgi:hypothetical protein
VVRPQAVAGIALHVVRTAGQKSDSLVTMLDQMPTASKIPPELSTAIVGPLSPEPINKIGCPVDRKSWIYCERAGEWSGLNTIRPSVFSGQWECNLHLVRERARLVGWDLPGWLMHPCRSQRIHCSLDLGRPD